MTEEAARWRERLAAAATAGDQAELRALFDEGKSMFGETLGQEWARALSALDSSAVTG